MAKHLEIFHKEKIGDPESFEYSSVVTFQKQLERQISEGVAITKSNLSHNRDHILINSKCEHHNPAVHRTSVSRQVRNGSWKSWVHFIFKFHFCIFKQISSDTNSKTPLLWQGQFGENIQQSFNHFIIVSFNIQINTLDQEKCRGIKLWLCPW